MTDVRCPICREVVASDGLNAHLHRHSLVRLVQALWRFDPLNAALAVLLPFLVGVLLFLVLWLATK